MAPSRVETDSYQVTERTTAGLTPEQLAFWNENGYLILHDELSPCTVSALLTEARDLLSSFSLTDHPMTKFSTGRDGKAHVGDDYFLTSGDKVRFFFEVDAIDGEGNLIKPKERAINKIGHSLHTLSPGYSRVSLNDRNAAIARSLGFQDPEVLQSMIICKQPEIGGAVNPHQDSTFLYTDPPSAVGFWYALEDATASNGCLSFLKGSHKLAPITQRLVRQPGGGTGFMDNRGTQFPQTDQATEIDAQLSGTKYTVEPVKAGTLVLIHGNLLHQSEKNLSSKSRFIYTFHAIEGGNTYDEKNWLQPTKTGFSKLYSR